MYKKKNVKIIFKQQKPLLNAKKKTIKHCFLLKNQYTYSFSYKFVLLLIANAKIL